MALLTELSLGPFRRKQQNWGYGRRSDPFFNRVPPRPHRLGLDPAGPGMLAAGNSHKRLGVQLQHLGINRAARRQGLRPTR